MTAIPAATVSIWIDTDEPNTLRIRLPSGELRSYQDPIAFATWLRGLTLSQVPTAPIKARKVIDADRLRDAYEAAKAAGAAVRARELARTDRIQAAAAKRAAKTNRMRRAAKELALLGI